MCFWGILQNVGPRCNKDIQMTAAHFLVEGPSHKLYSIYLFKKYDGCFKLWHDFRSYLYFDRELNQCVHMKPSIMHRFPDWKLKNQLIGLFLTLRTIICMAFLSHFPSQMDIIFNSKCITSMKSKLETCLNTHFNNGWGCVCFYFAGRTWYKILFFILFPSLRTDQEEFLHVKI
jgi:hypothetical protein